MRISDWSSDVCSSDLDFAAALTSSTIRVESGASQRRISRNSAACTSGMINNRLSSTPQRMIFPGGKLGRSVPQSDLSCKLLSLKQRDCRSEEHTSALQSLMRLSYAVFCLHTTKTITS